MLTEFEVKKIQEIVNDCQKYIQRHHKMASNFNLTDKEYKIYMKARQQGIRLTAVLDGVEIPIPVTRGVKA